MVKIQEKDLVLEVSKRLKTALSKAYPDKRILMTRGKDAYPSLKERTEQANSVTLKDNEAIIYISIHANKAFNRSARGYEIWYLDPGTRRDDLLDPSKYADSADILPILNDMLQEEFTTESIMIGKSILKGLGEVFGSSVPSRGLKAGGWEVVRSSRMPAVLVELGFLSNNEDVKLMSSETGLQKFAEALYKGIVEFIGTFERSGGFTTVQ
jgi:N-acetylmuramoyl-L-alanine amidase